MSDVTPPPPGEPTDGATPPPPPPPAAPTPPPPAPPMAAAPAAPGMVPQNGMGTAALIMGILQFICLGPIASVLAIIFGIIGLKKVKQGVANNRGMALSGLILGIIGLVVGFIVLIVLIVGGVFAAKEVGQAIDPANNAKTGLADGTYGMVPKLTVNLNSKCSFKGVPISAETQTEVGPEVNVVGENRTECGDGATTPSMVIFQVSGGVAKIVSVQ